MKIKASDFGFRPAKQSKSRSRSRPKQHDIFSMDIMPATPTSAASAAPHHRQNKRQSAWPLAEPQPVSMPDIIPSAAPAMDPFAASPARSPNAKELERQREARQMQQNMRQGRAAQTMVENQYRMAGYDIRRTRQGYDFEATKNGRTKRVEVKSGPGGYADGRLRPDQQAAQRRYDNYVVERTYDDDDDYDDDERPPYIDDDDAPDRPDRPDRAPITDARRQEIERYQDAKLDYVMRTMLRR